MRCPACESTRSSPRFRKNELEIRACADCGHGFVFPIPSPKELQALYSQNENPNLENGFAVELEALLDGDRDRLLAYFSDRLALLNGIPGFAERRILDFGCASGLFVEALKHAGAARAEGVDVVAEMIERGRARGLKLSNDTDGKFLPAHPGAFGLICANNVLEHLADPASVLRGFAEALEAGGHACIGVPNFASIQVRLAGGGSPIVDPPHHVHYFTPGSLARMFEGAGFEVLLCKTLFWGRETDTYLVAKGIPTGAAAAIRLTIAPLRAAIESMEMGGIIHLLARRKAVR